MKKLAFLMAKKEIVARLVPKSDFPGTRRKIGILESKGKVVIEKDFKMTDKEFLGV